MRSQMQYKASFVMMTLGQLTFAGTEFLCIVALFDRFKQLRGWTLPEAALLFGVVNVSFSICEAFTRGFDIFGSMVKSGDFDRLLLRPRGTVLQLLGQEVQMMRVGRLFVGLGVLVWAARAAGIAWTPTKIGLVMLSTAGSACVFAGLFILQATLAFWTIESLEIVNTVTYGGVETTQYPLSIYRPWLQRFFTFVIPFACVNYFPVLAILGRSEGPAAMAGWLSPAVGLVFLILCLRIWRFGVRHYCSTGS
jgi:ABC-2 type transport system permease protein